MDLVHDRWTIPSGGAACHAVEPGLRNDAPEAVEPRVDARGLRGPAVRAALAVGWAPSPVELDVDRRVVDHREGVHAEPAVRGERVPRPVRGVEREARDAAQPRVDARGVGLRDDGAGGRIRRRREAGEVVARGGRGRGVLQPLASLISLGEARELGCDPEKPLARKSIGML